MSRYNSVTLARSARSDDADKSIKWNELVVCKDYVNGRRWDRKTMVRNAKLTRQAIQNLFLFDDCNGNVVGFEKPVAGQEVYFFAGLGIAV